VSLIEVLASMLLLTIALVGGLQCLTHCIQLSQAAQKHWEGSLDTWNQAQSLRAQPPAGGDPVMIHPDTQPMVRFTLEGEEESDGPDWEILRAPK
jgi:hypothetical protein